MDYEEYVIEVTNNTDKVIALDSLENAKSTYLIRESDNKFSSYSGEMNNTYNKNNNDEDEDSINYNQLKQNNSITNNIIVPANTIKKISIKFNKMYNPERKIAKMEFSDVIEDYDYYLELKNKDDYNRKTVTINLQ